MERRLPRTLLMRPIVEGGDRELHGKLAYAFFVLLDDSELQKVFSEFEVPPGRTMVTPGNACWTT